MDITGTWKYTEDFEYGKSEGQVELIQAGNEVIGIFTFTEEVEDHYKIDVVERVNGTISEGKVLLKSFKVSAKQDGKEIDYLPNTFEVTLVSEYKLVGSAYDSEDICGVFVLEKI
jgi:hypothetical protein